MSEYNWRLTNRKIQQCKDIFRQLIAKPELLVESIFGVLDFEACKGKKESKKDFYLLQKISLELLVGL